MKNVEELSEIYFNCVGLCWCEKSFQKYISILKDCVDAKKAFDLENNVDAKKLSKIYFNFEGLCWCEKGFRFGK